MTTFCICRHGQTENNKLGRFSGWIDTPLTDEGVRNAKAAAAKLTGVRFDMVISSDLGRAFITAYLIARAIGFTGEIQREKGLREVDYGDFGNQPHAAYAKRTPEASAEYVNPNGESLAQMQRRVLTCIHNIAAANPGKTILLAAHDGTINAIWASFAGENIGVADRTSHPHDFVAKFSFDKGAVTSFEEVGRTSRA